MSFEYSTPQASNDTSILKIESALHAHKQPLPSGGANSSKFNYTLSPDDYSISPDEYCNLQYPYILNEYSIAFILNNCFNTHNCNPLYLISESNSKICYLL